MTLQQRILKHLASTPRCVAFKIEIANERGVPDILCCVSGRYLAIEVKEGKDVVSPIQNEQMRRIGEAQGWVIVARNFDVFKALFDDVRAAIIKGN